MASPIYLNISSSDTLESCLKSNKKVNERRLIGPAAAMFSSTSNAHDSLSDECRGDIDQQQSSILSRNNISNSHSKRFDDTVDGVVVVHTSQSITVTPPPPSDRELLQSKARTFSRSGMKVEDSKITVSLTALELKDAPPPPPPLRV